MNFSITNSKKFIDMDFRFPIAFILRKLPLSNFGVVLKKNIHNYLEKLLKYPSLKKFKK